MLRRIIAGDRQPSLADGLDDTDTAVVTAVLTALSAPPTEPDQP